MIFFAFTVFNFKNKNLSLEIVQFKYLYLLSVKLKKCVLEIKLQFKLFVQKLLETKYHQLKPSAHDKW